MKTTIPTYMVKLIPVIEFRYNQKIRLTFNGTGDIIITDTEADIQTITHVPEEATLSDIIKTIEDCLPLTK